MKRSPQPQPQRVFYNVGQRIPQCQLYGRRQTAIGIEPPSPWAEGEIFYGTLEQLCDHHRRIQEAAETAEREQRERIREEARAREPKSCPGLLTHAERKAIRPDPELIGMTKDEPPITETCRPVWLARDPDFFVSQLFSDSDILRVTLPGLGAQTAPFSDLKQHLRAYKRIVPNSLTIGAEPKRKHIVCRFGAHDLDSAWKPISFLCRQATLVMLVHDGATAQLEGWYNCEKWSAKKLEDFACLYLRLGGDPATLVADFTAALPGALVQSPIPLAYQQLQSAGFLRDAEQLKPRAFVLAFNPPKSE